MQKRTWSRVLPLLQCLIGSMTTSLEIDRVREVAEERSQSRLMTLLNERLKCVNVQDVTSDFESESDSDEENASGDDSDIDLDTEDIRSSSESDSSSDSCSEIESESSSDSDADSSSNNWHARKRQRVA